MYKPYIGRLCVLHSQVQHFGQHINVAADWTVPVVSVTGPWAEVMPAERQLLSGQAATEVAFFWTRQGTEAPGVCRLFSWKLVRIKSLPCGPLCPAEVDKHGWSRSETSLPGGKEQHWMGAATQRLERKQIICLSKVF